jgi:tRNA nucleotidyltransferase (CCA-adding enzyme)
MKVTNVEDYDRAVQEFVANMRRLGADVVSVLLYGSIARGSVVPGESDLLDAQVFLRDEVFQTKERFLNVLETMVESFQRLSRTGIPFHPFLYFSLAEASCSPALYTENWQS